MRLNLKLSDKILLVLLLIIVCTYIFIRIFSKKAEILLLNYTSYRLTNTITSIIDKSLRNILYEQKYDDLIIDNRDENNNIVNLDFNSKELNNILYLVNEDILNSISSLENNNTEFKTKKISSNKRVFYVPLGVIYNTPILNNIGPKIPFKVEIIGSVNSETKIDVKEYGINSSLIELLLNININMKVILPFISKNINVKKSIILDSKVIQGKVPDYYGGLMGVN